MVACPQRPADAPASLESYQPFDNFPWKIINPPIIFQPVEPRYLTAALRDDALARGKIAFVSGPRQVGKTTLAKALLETPENYFVFDDERFRRAWTRSAADAIAGRGPGPVVLDEIHKDRRWKTKLKGLHDAAPGPLPLIVTGSARLDLARRGADSLLGRYLPYRLHPFSVGEQPRPPAPDAWQPGGERRFAWEDLLRLGGFPEPLLDGSEAHAQRWSRLRLERLALEDARDLLNVTDQQALLTLLDLLPLRVGSLLSVRALHEDVGKAYATVRTWLEVADALFFSFTVRPWTRRVHRALTAMPKLYLFDILRIPAAERARRLENLCALHLLKACHFWTDAAQGEFALHFVRDKEGREADFLVTRDREPWLLAECKTGQREPAAELLHFRAQLNPARCVQLVDIADHDREHPAHGVRVMSYEKFFAGGV